MRKLRTFHVVWCLAFTMWAAWYAWQTTMGRDLFSQRDDTLIWCLVAALQFLRIFSKPRESKFRQNLIVHRAAQRLATTYPDIKWAVIHPSDIQADGWDYQLIREGWGYEAALRRKRQLGGRIINIRL